MSNKSEVNSNAVLMRLMAACGYKFKNSLPIIKVTILKIIIVPILFGFAGCKTDSIDSIQKPKAMAKEISTVPYVPEKGKINHIAVDTIVLKYIPVGTKKEKALNTLREQGFNSMDLEVYIKYVRDNYGYVLLSDRDEKKMKAGFENCESILTSDYGFPVPAYLPPPGDAVRVDLCIKEGSVTKIRATYHKIN